MQKSSVRSMPSASIGTLHLHVSFVLTGVRCISHG